MPEIRQFEQSGIQVSDLPVPEKSRDGWPWTEAFDPGEEFKLAGGQSWPKISIVTPSYNRIRFFEETLRSVILQGYPNLEFIIMDAGSTDGSIELIKKYEPWIASWVSVPDGGQTDAVNKGWAKATGEILGWLATDDIYLPGTLWRVAMEYRKSEFAALAGGTDVVDIDGLFIGRKGGKSFEPESILTGAKPGSPASFYRHDILDQVGDMRLDLTYNPDREFAIRIGEKFWPDMARTVSEPFSAFRLWDESITGAGGRAAVSERISVVDEYLARNPELSNAGGIRTLSLHRIYISQAKREKEVNALGEELRFRLLAFFQKPTGLGAAKILARALQLLVKSPSRIGRS
ncbi:glycosyltransferase family 2 protein [Candidatus Lucifugimonas marina]|uniref:Glycosyltransferase n=1 Tax=Candidatus Lucifugimonas marina TaxID=3038979 RepID=A0AAJ5ZCI9_9CHLR|nr:glycosyltransferase [SAR202 cluster bacterium JH702]MDG0868267.1 glycosyltransferase [SAR202 cluster bacterium JH639]WFG34911.1 glycosyltransferase [SAR202 cluster bacterium JH545]WFG38862.1 glycosyltransferase [SAR202 cluster bacterium JH1073]